MEYDDLTSFEKFVSLTDFIWYFLDVHPYVSLIASACVIATNWAIFRHHFDEVKNHQYFMDNIEVTGRFCGPSYDMWRTVAMAALPVGLTVILFTIVTSGRTKPFIAVFGTRGASKFKMQLIRKALRYKEKQS